MKKQEPIPLSFEVANGMVAELASLKFFPKEPEARLSLVRLVSGMCEYEHQLRWLIGRLTSGVLYDAWPGPRELRACYCSKFKPRDGIEVSSQIYLDGIPSETGRQEFEPAKLSPAAERKLLAEFAIAPKSLPAGKPDPNPKGAERSLAVNAAAKAELSDTDKPEEACLIQKP